MKEATTIFINDDQKRRLREKWQKQTFISMWKTFIQSAECLSMQASSSVSSSRFGVCATEQCSMLAVVEDAQLASQSLPELLKPGQVADEVLKRRAKAVKPSSGRPVFHFEDVSFARGATFQFFAASQLLSASKERVSKKNLS
ncbi:unnamed protein product [Toxocara canis]|uniref:Uncharacterized protein n=1 Tax=Toxocara canis TaxID=6265 RepID=A0A183UCF1_TOXCA|nr:unnamed protein product [Toxocara canis]